MNKREQLLNAQSKLDSGAALSNEELLMLKQHYQELANAFSKCIMPKHEVFAHDVWLTLDRVKDMLAARNKHEDVYGLKIVKLAAFYDLSEGLHDHVETLSGTFSEMCDVLKKHGVQYSSFNNGVRSLCIFHNGRIYDLYRITSDPASEF